MSLDTRHFSAHLRWKIHPGAIHIPTFKDRGALPEYESITLFINGRWVHTVRKEDNLSLEDLYMLELFYTTGVC
jgi:hypothetical protein